MKKIMMALAVAMLTAACDRRETQLDAELNPVDSTMTTMEIHFSFQNFSIIPMTRSTLSDAGVSDLWLFDYLDGALVATVHQTKDDDGFGTVSLTADYGDHMIYFVASAGGEPVVDGTTITWTIPRDTFWKSLVLTVAPATSSNQSVSLQRVVTRFRVAATDEVPDGIATLCLTPSHWYYGLDYTTGEPVDDRNTVRSVNVPASYIGTSGSLAMAIYGFCPSSGMETDIQVTAKASDESTMADITLSGVPLQRNRITSYSGELFGATRSMSVSVDDTWDEDYDAVW